MFEDEQSEELDPREVVCHLCNLAYWGPLGVCSNCAAVDFLPPVGTPRLRVVGEPGPEFRTFARIPDRFRLNDDEVSGYNRELFLDPDERR